jgi:phenylacetate-coenzyme A ligase PaaK-like adenylate-forming protein
MVESFRDKPYTRRHFAQIVEYARTYNPFYRRWIQDPNDVPIVDRTTFLENNSEILNGYPVTGSTSGSTGVPVRFSQSGKWVRAAREDTLRFVRQFGGPLPAVLIAYPDHKSGEDLLDVKSPTDEQIEFIRRRHRQAGTAAVTTYPTNAQFLAEKILSDNIDMSFIRRFGLYGESVEPFQTELVQRAFPKARVWTSYSSMEFSIIASVCPFEPEFHHINAHRLGVEVLRDDGSASAFGERGRVVITDFLNRRSPFIRYEIGDYAMRERCPCGRIALPAFGRIYGKVRGALLHRNGNRVLFADLSVALRELSGMRQYQVIQDGLEDFTVKVVAAQCLDSEIRTAFEGHFGYLPDSLRIESVDSIPRGENGKFYASICRV